MGTNCGFDAFPFLVILPLFSFHEATAAPEPLINAKFACKGQFGYHVSIEMFNISICGGGIIDDRYVISAAHCIINKNNEFEGVPLTVVVGTVDLNDNDCKNKVSVDVEQVFVPAEYNSSDSTKITRTVGDIAVLKLKSDLGLTKHKYLKKLKLPTKDKSYEGKEAIVTGFGYTEYDKSKKFTAQGCGSRDNKLRYTKTFIINNVKCQVLRKKPISESHICASSAQLDPDLPTGVCDGDSGGPLVYKMNQIIGVVSSSPKHCREDKAPAVYTKVWPFVGFITKARQGYIDKSLRSITLSSNDIIHQ